MKVTAKTPKASAAKVNSEESVIDVEERIRRRAYELYERRGQEDGYGMEDWLQAEAEIAAERSQAVAAATVRKSRRWAAQPAKAKTTPAKNARASARTRAKEEITHGR